MNSNDPVRDRIEAAERMLLHARQQHIHGNAEDAVEFLAAARRNIDRAAEALKHASPVVTLSRTQREKTHA